MERVRALIVVLAGGLGTRLRPLTGQGPKALADVAGIPMLRHVLTHWRERGASEAVLCLGYRADHVEGALAGWTDLGLDVTVSREPFPLGTGGAIRFALDKLPEEFFVVNGDTLVDASLEAVARWHRRRGWHGTLLVHRGAATEGDCILVGDDGAIRAFAGRGTAEQGSGVFAGLALLRRTLFGSLASGTVANLEADVLAPALAAGIPLGALCTRRPFFDLGTPERLQCYGRKTTGG